MTSLREIRMDSQRCVWNRTIFTGLKKNKFKKKYIASVSTISEPNRWQTRRCSELNIFYIRPTARKNNSLPRLEF